jgi:LacI family transcriptional regulator
VSNDDQEPAGVRVRATMRDVAALAGVGLKTVSRVVNGVPTVAPELASRVHQAADKLGYRPNLTASSLRRADGRSRTIGLLLEDVSNPFSAALHRAVENVAREHRTLLLTGSLDENAARERELARTLIDRGVDGLLVVPAGRDHSYLIHEQQSGVPVGFLDREPALIAADSVLSDNRRGAVTAVEHLLAIGHRRIGYLGDSTTIATAHERFTGYRDALTGSGLTVDESIVRHDLRTADAAERAALEMLTATDPPTALFTSQNLVTIGAIHGLWTLGLQETVALVGFDDFILADTLRPGVTTVAQNPGEMGKLAAELLFARIDGDRSPAQLHVIPTRLIIRGSGEIPPTRLTLSPDAPHAARGVPQGEGT